MATPSACIGADPGDVAKVVLMPGDPLRAKYVADTYLTDVVCFNEVRNMFGYTGYYKGKRVSVMGSGMGVPSICLYAHELYTFLGVEAIIRIGSAGALSEKTQLKDVLIAMGASTNSAYAEQYPFPGMIAPVADYELFSYAIESAKERSIKTSVGQVFTSDQFYSSFPDRNNILANMGIMAVEMETAGLYVEAIANRKKALSILSISDNIITGEGLSAGEIREGFNDMMLVSLDTAYKYLENLSE